MDHINVLALRACARVVRRGRTRQLLMSDDEVCLEENEDEENDVTLERNDDDDGILLEDNDDDDSILLEDNDDDDGILLEENELQLEENGVVVDVLTTTTT